MMTFRGNYTVHLEAADTVFHNHRDLTQNPDGSITIRITHAAYAYIEARAC